MVALAVGVAATAAVLPAPSATELAADALAPLPIATAFATEATDCGPMATESAPVALAAAPLEFAWKYLVAAPAVVDRLVNWLKLTASAAEVPFATFFSNG